MAGAAVPSQYQDFTAVLLAKAGLQVLLIRLNKTIKNIDFKFAFKAATKEIRDEVRKAFRLAGRSTHVYEPKDLIVSAQALRYSMSQTDPVIQVSSSEARFKPEHENRLKHLIS